MDVSETERADGHLPHQLQQREHQSGASAQTVVRVTAQLHEAVEALRILAAARDEALHLWREDEGRPVPVRSQSGRLL